MSIQGKAWHQTVIPCRPTAPTGISVEITKDGETLYAPDMNDIETNWTYSPREGLVIHQTGVADSGYYTCTATRDDAEQTYLFHLIVSTVPEDAPEPTITRVGGRHVEVGGNFTLKCTVTYPVGGHVYLNWTFPDASGLAERRINISETTRAPSGPSNYEATSLLTVHRAKDSDAGQYTCIASNDQDRGEESTFVEIFAENTAVLNITLDVKDIEVTAPGVARWVATIHAAHPRPEIIWKNPRGEELKTEMNFTTVATTETASSLEIRKVQGRDSGCYTFFAQTANLTMTANLTLKVREKPIASIENNNPFVVYAEKQSVSCIVDGYPLAQIEWEFRNCYSPTNCDKTFQSITTYNPNKVQGARALIEAANAGSCELTRRKSTILLKGIQSGEYRCFAKNEFGRSEATTQFFVVPSAEPIDFNVSKTEFYVGETLSMKCGISLFNFTRGISWQFQASPSAPVVDITEGQNGLLLIKEENQYGYYHTLEKQNATLTDSGLYICSARSLKNEQFVQSANINLAIPTRPHISSLTVPERVEKGSPVILQCNYTGKPTPKATWTKDGSEISRSEQNILTDDGYSATLKLPFVSSDQAGKYACILRSIAGVTYEEATIFVDEPPISVWIPIVGVALAVTVIVLLVILTIKIRKEKQRKAFLALHNLEKFEEGNPEIINPEQTLDEQAELLPYNKKTWEFPTERLKLGKQLGAGAFGRVVKAEALGITEGEAKTIVAVKMLKASPDREALTNALQALVKELKIMTNLGKHLNVVNLLGACTRDIDKGELFLIVEYCKFGNILRYMQKKRTNFIDQVDRRTSKIDVAIGAERLVRSMSGTSQRSVSSTAPLIPPDSPLIQFTPSPTGKHAPASLYGHENGAMTYVRRLSSGITSGNEDSSGQFMAPWALNYRGDIDDKPLCTNDLLCWAYQIASGMEYLASRKVCHGDLAARNILLAENNIVKISDFGLSREVYSGLYTKKSDTPMPVKWMAPESITTRVFSTQSDVWAFGVTLWEIFSLGEMPYAGVEANMKFVQSLMDGTGLLKMPAFSSKDIFDVMSECWRRHPKERPNFSELKEHISCLLDETTKQMYMDLNQSYITMNQTQFRDRIDYLIQMANPVYENFQGEEGMLGHDYINSPRPAVEVADDGYLSPKQVVLNNSGYMTGVNGQTGSNPGSQVFVFPDATATFRRLSKLEEEPSETQPMLDDTGYLQPAAIRQVDYVNINS